MLEGFKQFARRVKETIPFSQSNVQEKLFQTHGIPFLSHIREETSKDPRASMSDVSMVEHVIKLAKRYGYK